MYIYIYILYMYYIYIIYIYIIYILCIYIICILYIYHIYINIYIYIYYIYTVEDFYRNVYAEENFSLNYSICLFYKLRECGSDLVYI